MTDVGQDRRLATVSLEHLLQVARRLDIRGRSRLTKAELVAAIAQRPRHAPVARLSSRIVAAGQPGCGGWPAMSRR